MTDFDILLPVFLQILLTFVLMVWMAVSRTGALKRKELHIRDMALGQQAWPARVTQISNAFHNQLQLPVLFYVLVAFVLITNSVTVTLVVLAWLFVATRLVHAYIHAGSNYVPWRAYVFFVNGTILMIMWAVFAVQFGLRAG